MVENAVVAKREIPIPPLTHADIAFHVIGVTLNWACTLWGLLWLVTTAYTHAPSWPVLAAVVLTGLLLADFFSGLLHWAFDTWFTEHTPFMGRMVLLVREHHVYPQHIFRYRFYYEAGSVSWASLAHTGPVIGFVTLGSGEVGAVGYSAVLISVMISFLTLFMLEFHKLGHRKSKSRLVLFLQRWHLLMSVRHHGQHHRDAHDTKYCLINGWADRLCDSTGFWRGVERLISSITGATPRSNDDEWMRRYRGRGSERPARLPAETIRNEK